MSLTTADLPAILADLARLEPERFRAFGSPPYTYQLTHDGRSGWHYDLERPDDLPFVLPHLQATVQEAITARGWDYALGNGRSLIAISGDGPFAYVAPHGGHVPWAYADLPAVALAGAFRDALLAQQESS